MKIKIMLSMLAAALLAAACKPETEEILPPDAPVLEITEQTSTSFTVAWDAVEGADRYTWDFNAEQGDTEETSLSFDGLESDAAYTVRVKSVSTTTSTESDWAEIEVILVSGTDDVKFNITAYEEDYFIHVSTEPTADDFPYYFEPIPASIYDSFGNDPEAMFEELIASRVEAAGGDAGAAFLDCHFIGAQDKSYNISMYLEQVWYVLIGGINVHMTATTPVEAVEVPVDMPHSDNTFTVALEECSLTAVEFKVTPSNDDQYAVVLYDTEDVDELSQTQLRAFLRSLVTDNSLCRGEETARYERNIMPSHAYSFFVFGYENGVITTDGITREDVVTPDPEVVDELEFTFNIEVLGPQKADVEIIPSNEEAAYYYEVVSAEAWVNTYQSSGRKVIEAYAGGNVASYLDRWGSTGTQTYTYDSFVLSNPDGDDYVLFAVGYNIVGGEVEFTTEDYEEFSTIQQGGGGQDEEITFTFNIMPQGPGEVYVEVVPSVESTSYFYEVVPLSDWAMFYQGNPVWYIEDNYYGYGYDSPAAFLSDNGVTGTDGYLYDNLTPGKEYVVFAIGFGISGDNVSYFNYEYLDFTAPEEQGGGDDDGLTFDLSIEGEANGEFVVNIQPSDETVPYIYAVMSELEWDKYFPDNLYDYFYQRYEASGYEGSFAQYIEDNSRTGSYYGTSTGFYNDGREYYFQLIAAGVTVEGEDVTFYSQTDMEDFYATW